MTEKVLQPQTTAELQAMVTAAPLLSVRGGGSKPALSAPAAGAVCVDLRRLSGVIEYVPDEYVFTAYAGTPVSHVADELSRHGQYLPFDPLLAGRGATLGGTVAANTCGSGRFRYGGVRDFILGVRFIDGRGQLVRSGGRVVKNAAGFDLPKFFVGSLGRYGILVEVSFKVFPRPRSYLTLEFTYPSLTAAQAAVFRLTTQPLDIDALDFEPAEKTACRLHVRLGGLEAGLPERAARLEEFLQSERQPLPQQLLPAFGERGGVSPPESEQQPLPQQLLTAFGERGGVSPPESERQPLSQQLLPAFGERGGVSPPESERQPLPQQLLLGDGEAAYWREVNNFSWVPPQAALLKVPLPPRSVPLLDARLQSAVRRYTAGGNVAWLAVNDMEAARAALTELGLTGLRIWGPGGEPFVGPRRGMVLAQRAKRALDPSGKFGEP